MARSETLTDLPATVTVALRPAMEVFRSTVSVIVAVPAPLVGEGLIQAAPEIAVQLHAPVVVMSTAAVPPPSEKIAAVGLTVNVQPGATSVTLTV